MVQLVAGGEGEKRKLRYKPNELQRVQGGIERVIWSIWSFS